MSQSYREWPSRVKESSLKWSSTKYASRLASNNTHKISENGEDIQLQRASRERNTVFSEESRAGMALNLDRATLLLTMGQVFQDDKGKWFPSKCPTLHLIPARCEGKLTMSRSVMSQKTPPCSLPQESAGRWSKEERERRIKCSYHLEAKESMMSQMLGPEWLI